MVRDDQVRWSLWVKGASFLAVIAGELFLTSGDNQSNNILLQALAPPMTDGGLSTAVGKGEVKPFRDWPAQGPDLALVLTGQMHGYYDPCGCSRPQLGGLERRYNFVQSLRDKGWKVVPIDLGDVFEDRGRRKPQYLVKYRKAMEAMAKIGYQGVGLGLHEMEVPLLTAMAEYPLNWPNPPVIGTNLMNRDQNFPGMIQPWSVSGGQDGAPRVGIASIIGPSVAREVPQNQKPAVQFNDTRLVLAEAFRAFDKERVEIRVLLYQGNIDEAKACATNFPQLDVIVIPSREEEPSAKPTRVGNTLIVDTGHKGRYVGVVGCFPTGQANRPYELRYQFIAMTEDLKTPPGQEKKNPIISILEEYAKEVARDNYLSRYPRSKHPIQLQFPNAHYVGSDACKKCHQDSFVVWKDHPHHHAFETLVNVERPPLRHLDGECVSCHVVGFGHETGYEHQFKFDNNTLSTLKETIKLRDVGCESCHGPGSEHIAQKNNKLLHDLMNPFRYDDNETPAARQRRHNLIDRSCQQCHDQDNDVHWDFIKKWPKVVHPEKERPKASKIDLRPEE